jgi:hypothetical protein
MRESSLFFDGGEVEIFRGGAGGEDQHDEVVVLLVSNVQHGCADVLDKMIR